MFGRILRQNGGKSVRTAGDRGRGCRSRAGGLGTRDVPPLQTLTEGTGSECVEKSSQKLWGARVSGRPDEGHVAMSQQ